MTEYLWCSKCEKVSEDSKWNRDKFKYGVCPYCGRSAYRNAVEWVTLCEVAGYDSIPDQGRAYPKYPSFEL